MTLFLLIVALFLAVHYIPEYLPDYGVMLDALEKDDLELLRTYLERGGDPNSHNAWLYDLRWFLQRTSRGTDLRPSTDTSESLLGKAANGCRIEHAKLLLEFGADPNHVDGYGYTPLIRAAGCEDPSLVKALLDKGADPRVTNPDGDSALRRADGRYWAIHPESIRLLEEALRRKQ